MKTIKYLLSFFFIQISIICTPNGFTHTILHFFNPINSKILTPKHKQIYDHSQESLKYIEADLHDIHNAFDALKSSLYNTERTLQHIESYLHSIKETIEQYTHTTLTQTSLPEPPTTFKPAIPQPILTEAPTKQPNTTQQPTTLKAPEKPEPLPQVIPAKPRTKHTRILQPSKQIQDSIKPTKAQYTYKDPNAWIFGHKQQGPDTPDTSKQQDQCKLYRSYKSQGQQAMATIFKPDCKSYTQYQTLSKHCSTFSE